MKGISAETQYPLGRRTNYNGDSRRTIWEGRYARRYNSCGCHVHLRHLRYGSIFRGFQDGACKRAGQCGA